MPLLPKTSPRPSTTRLNPAASFLAIHSTRDQATFVRRSSDDPGKGVWEGILVAVTFCVVGIGVFLAWFCMRSQHRPKGARSLSIRVEEGHSSPRSPIELPAWLTNRNTCLSRNRTSNPSSSRQHASRARNRSTHHSSNNRSLTRPDPSSRNSEVQRPRRNHEQNIGSAAINEGQGHTNIITNTIGTVNINNVRAFSSSTTSSQPAQEPSTPAQRKRNRDRHAMETPALRAQAHQRHARNDDGTAWHEPAEWANGTRTLNRSRMLSPVHSPVRRRALRGSHRSPTRGRAMSMNRWIDNVPGGCLGDSDSETEVEIEDGIVTPPRWVRDLFRVHPWLRGGMLRTGGGGRRGRG